MKTAHRILTRVASARPCTTIAFLAADLRVPPERVRHFVSVLAELGCVEKVKGTHGCDDYYVVTSHGCDECDEVLRG